MNPSFSIFQVTEGLSSRLGGTAVAVSHLSNYLAGQGLEVSLFDFSPTATDDRLVPMDPRIKITEYPPGLFPRIGYCRSFQHSLKNMPFPDLFHLHGLWRLYYWQAASFAQKSKIPYVFSAHGMLEPWALEHRRTNKQIARFLYQDPILQKAGCLLATSTREKETFENLGFRGPIATVPLGVEVPPPKTVHGKIESLSSWGIPEEKRLLLFLSRIHVQKGLDLLLPAWARVQNQFKDWVLMLAGTGDEDYSASLRETVKKLGIEKNVIFYGIVDGGDKEKLFERAELLLLPSHSENFGYVIAEALARCVPVLTTKNTPWSKIEETGCGWWIELGVEQLVQALQEALGKSSRELRTMGEKGRALIQKDYSLGASGHAMMELYGWLLGRGAKPTFVTGI